TPVRYEQALQEHAAKDAALLRCQGSAGARPCPGRSSLDRTCAPAEYGSYREARTGTISQIEVSTLSGEPRYLLFLLPGVVRCGGCRRGLCGGLSCVFGGYGR